MFRICGLPPGLAQALRNQASERDTRALPMSCIAGRALRLEIHRWPADVGAGGYISSFGSAALRSCHAAAGKGVGGMETGDRFEGHAGQIYRADVEGTGKAHQGTNCPVALVIWRQAVAGDGGVEMKSPTGSIRAWLDPTFQASFSAEIDPAGALGVLGVRYDHYAGWVAKGKRGKIN